MRPIVKAGLVGLAAWALWPRSRDDETITGAGSGVPVPAAPQGTNWDKVYLKYCVGDAASGQYVLSTGQPDPVNYQVEMDNLHQGITMQGASPEFYKQFKRQVEDPAGRVKCSDVQPYHFQLAQAAITGQLPRADKSGRLYKQMLDQIAQNKKNAEDLAIANQVIGAVAALIPVVGGAIKLAVGTGLTEGTKGAIQNALNESEALAAIDEIAQSMGANSPEGRMWLSNDQSAQPAEPALVHGCDVYSIGVASQGGYYRRDSDGEAVFPLEATHPVKVDKNGQHYTTSEIRPGYTFIPVGAYMRLFTMHQYGWILPWLSPLLGSDDTLERQISIISPVVRAFDIVRTKTFPIPPSGENNPVMYWYVNPVHGLMMGSKCPPTSEDKHYVDDDGHEYSFNGKKGGIPIASTYIRDLSTWGGAQPVAVTTLVGATSTPQPTPSAGEDYGQAAQQEAKAAALQQAAATVVPTPKPVAVSTVTPAPSTSRAITTFYR